MQNFAPTALDDGLVPLGRLGAALHARRDTASVASLSRSSEGRYLPDELMTLERGDTPIDDERILELVSLYELPSRPLALGAAVEVVFDRSTGRDVLDGSASIFGGGDVETAGVDVDAVLARFVALSVLLRLDVTCGSVGLDRLAVALHLDPEQLSDRLSRLIDGRGDDIVGLVEQLSTKVVVPLAGLLITQLAGGSLLLVKRQRVAATGPAVAPCGRLGDLLDQAS